MSLLQRRKYRQGELQGQRVFWESSSSFFAAVVTSLLSIRRLVRCPDLAAPSLVLETMMPWAPRPSMGPATQLSCTCPCMSVQVCAVS